jgi:hypothetical protein
MVGVLLAAVAVLVAACSGMGSEPQADYRQVLEERYVPLKQALDAAVEPCQAEDFPTCRRHMTRALDAAEMLRERLMDADVPEGLEDADRQFKRGLSALADVLEQTLAAIDAGDEDEVARLHMEQHAAGADVNNPLGLFNQKLGLKLRPH